MQGKGSDEPPPLAVDDHPGIGAAESRPVGIGPAEPGKIEPGEVVEGSQQEEHREGGEGVFRQGPGGGGRGRPVAVFLFEKAQLVQSVVEPGLRHQQAPAFPLRLDAAGKIARLQHQRPERYFAFQTEGTVMFANRCRVDRTPLLRLPYVLRFPLHVVKYRRSQGKGHQRKTHSPLHLFLQSLHFRHFCYYIFVIFSV